MFMHPVNPTTAAADATPADPPLADPHATAHALVEQQLAMLTRLAEMGMRIAEATERWALAALEDGSASYVVPENHVMAEAPGGFRGDPGLVFSRVARAVRLTLMLQTRLLSELPALARAETAAHNGRAEARRERLHRLVERAIRAEHDEPEAVEQLSGEAWERLREENLHEQIEGRSFGEIVARICADLGLSPDGGGPAVATVGGVAKPLEHGPPSLTVAVTAPPAGEPGRGICAPCQPVGRRRRVTKPKAARAPPPDLAPAPSPHPLQT